MAKQKSTKRALWMSVLSLVLCIAMLAGTTFAWFTDSVSSENNIIVAGNLDVELYWSVDAKNWQKVNDQTNVFEGNDFWEPGHTEVVYLKVVNEGSLALKYRLGVNIVKEIGSVNVNDEPFKLSDFIKYSVLDGANNYANRNQAIAAAEANGATKLNVPDSVSNALVSKQEDVVTMVVYMPTTVGNDANYKTGEAVPTINLGIDLFATQVTVESDSFGDDYDKGAPWTGMVNTDWYFEALAENPNATEFTVTSAEELAGLAAIVNGTATAPVVTYAAEPATVQDTFAGKTVKLAADVNLNDVPWTPIGRIGVTSTDFTYSFKGTFDGQNHTVSNLDVSAYGWAGLFGLAHGGAQINNVKVDGVSIVANRMAGAVVGQLYGSIDNCHVTNADIKVTPNALEGGYDNGDKVGGIVGWLGDNNNHRTLTNCSATKVELGAYRDVGGIAGYVASSTTVSGNKVDELTVTVDQISHFYGEKDPNAGAIYGRTGGTITDTNNAYGENVTVTSTISKGGITYVQDGLTKETTLYLVPADYAGTTVNVAPGTDAIGGYAFYYSKNVETIVLPSTVTTLNDRAFRGASASTVVLNEGLTNISYQAFRDALNVKSVEIPSTVKTISKEAFQSSGITELTVPATVTTLEYGACRDMKQLETVTIEGNVDIPVYAFRACTNLKTVVLKGDDVTFGGGSRGMIFTNKENGDGTAITVYVKNETVKERLLAADTAAKDYGGYKIELITTAVSSEAELAEAFASGGQIKLEADVALTEALEIKKDAVVDLNGKTISGQEKTLLKISSGNVTLKNGTIKNVHAAATDTKYSVYLSGDAVVTIEDMNIETSGVGIYACGGAKIEELNANVDSYMNANGVCCFDAVSLYDNARIDEITDGTYKTHYDDAYIQSWYEDSTHTYSAIESWPISLNSAGASIGKISGGTFLGVMDKANNGTAIHVNAGTIGEISGGYFGFVKTGLANPSRLIFVNTANGGSIGKITGGTFEKGSLSAGFGCDFAGIVDASGCEVKETGETVDVAIQFSTKVTTYTLKVVEVSPKG